jgi:hypothetical protein
VLSDLNSRRRPGPRGLRIGLAVLGLLLVSPVVQAAHDKTRANSYDDAWQNGPNGWVANAKAILAGGTNKTPGFTLLLGDSLTHGYGFTKWAQEGAGKTAEDAMITQWMHAGPASATPSQRINSKDGFALSNPYFCNARSFTVGDGLGAWHVLGKYGGMLPDNNFTTARQKLLDCAAQQNSLNIYTILAAFPDAQFAVPEYNLESTSLGFDIKDFTTVVDLLISRNVVPIIITYTYRICTLCTPFNQWVDNYNTALVQLAQSRRLPLIDLNGEMLARRPFQNSNSTAYWMTHFLGSDGVHYTNDSIAYPAGSDPYKDGGDPATHTTGAALMDSGYGLKAWLIVQKMKEIKALVIDSGPPPVLPEPPTGLRVTDTKGQLVTFGWTPPALGPRPTGYQLEGGTTPGQVLATIPLEAIPTASLSLPRGSFYIRMRTLSGADASAPSNEILANVAVAASPSPPENVRGLVDGDRLGLTWRNTFEGGEPTSAVLDVTGAVTASLSLGLTESFAFAGVPPGQYSFAVRTTNASGSSVRSNTVALTFPGPCSGAPRTPVNFVAVNAGNRVHVSWDAAAGGPAPSRFLLHVTGSFDGSFGMTGRAFGATAPAGSYSISVSAENSCGTSAATAATLITVP